MKRHAYIFIATLGGCLAGPLEASDAEIQAGRSHELFEQLHKFKDTYQDLREHYVEFIQQQINVFDEVLREAKNIETSKIESKKLQEFSLLQGKELLSEEEELNVRSKIMELNLTLLVIKELILNISLGKKQLKEEAYTINSAYDLVSAFLRSSEIPEYGTSPDWLNLGNHIRSFCRARLHHSLLFIQNWVNPQE